MNQREQAALDAVKSSKKYSQIAPEAVERTFEAALSRYPSLKQAEKAARSALHQIAGAFMPDNQKAARAMLDQYLEGDASALDRALMLHASTRERAGARALFERVFEKTGARLAVLDFACGLNPLVLGAMGIAARGYDIHLGAVNLVNEWAAARGWQVFAEARDLLRSGEFPRANLALFMKLLPTLEAQRTGSAMELVGRVCARFKLITFPTKTLSGRSVGMKDHYSAWLMKNLPSQLTIIDSFEMDGELIYLTEDQNG